MPSGAAVKSAVTLHASAGLQDDADPLWQALVTTIEGRLAWAGIDEATVPLPALAKDEHRPLRWAYLESDFLYAAHRTRAAEGEVLEPSGTRFPVVLVFVEAADAQHLAEGAVGPLSEWLRSAGGAFSDSRLLLVVYGARPPTLRPPAAGALAGCLLRHGAGAVELRSAAHAAEYVVQCAMAVGESRRRRMPSRFKVAGARCQTLPRDPADRLRLTWVSQLMQVPGVSEEIAKAIVSRYPSPAALMDAVGRATSTLGPEQNDAVANSGRVLVVADTFLADLEVPIRGKQGTRRLGPVVSRRVFSLFHPGAVPEQALV